VIACGTFPYQVPLPTYTPNPTYTPQPTTAAVQREVMLFMRTEFGFVIGYDSNLNGVADFYEAYVVWGRDGGLLFVKKVDSFSDRDEDGVVDVELDST